MLSITKQNWITVAKTCEAPYMRKEFFVDQPIQGEIAICGLGFFALFLNGQPVTDQVMMPVWSDYQDRGNRKLLYPLQDSFAHRVYYLTFDLTPYLTDGANTLGVVLGNGWYNQYERNVEGNLWYAHPKLCFHIQGTNAAGQAWTLDSDTSMKWAQSPIVYNNIYYGEQHNYAFRQPGWNQNGFDDSGWFPCLPVDGPDAIYEEQVWPADRRIRSLLPTCIHEFQESTIYDAGENIAGWVRLRYLDPEGGPVKIRYAEELLPDGHLDFSTAGGDRQIQQDGYANPQLHDILEPKFSWKGFRYFEVIGAAQPLDCVVSHTDIPVTSSFRCDNEVLQWLYDAYLRTQLANIHSCVPSDCPTRERLGYTGDGGLTADACMLLTDSAALYQKWMQDIADGQDPRTGHIQHTAPFYGGGGGPGGWGGAIVFVPYFYYQHYGDLAVLKKYYGNMLRYLDYLRAHTTDGLVTSEEEGGWCLGEWVTPEPLTLPEPFVNTYFAIKAITYVLEISQLLDLQPAPVLREDLQIYRDAMVRHYYHAQSNCFCEGIQGAAAFAADIGLGNPAMMEEMNAYYQRRGSFDTGIFGTPLVIKGLLEYGYTQTAVQLLTSRLPGSFGYMMEHDATTLWEEWGGTLSHNHPALGACVSYLFTGLLGIQQPEGCTGYRQVTIRPCPVEGISHMEGHIHGLGGVIAVSYQQAAGQICFTVTLGEQVSGTFQFQDQTFPLRSGNNFFRFAI